MLFERFQVLWYHSLLLTARSHNQIYQQQQTQAINISYILFCSSTVWQDIVTHIITLSNMMKQSDVIKSHYRGFSSSGVVGIKILLFARRFWHPHQWCFFQYFRACQKSGSEPVFKSLSKLCFGGLTTFTVTFELKFELKDYFCIFPLSICACTSLFFFGKHVSYTPSGQHCVASNVTYLSFSDNFLKVCQYIVPLESYS